ncbi:MAG: hypothetical protein II032_04000 [Treponema sp.]|nr:hypothetical protein [Treponema sp.]
MKRIAICILVISSLLFISACTTNKVVEKAGNDTQTYSTTPFQYKPSVSHSYLTEENIGQEIVVKGKIIKDGSSYTLLENPDSKSRVSFVLDFEDESLKEKLSAGSLVQLSGILTSAESPWKKGMKVLKVE